MTTSVSVELIVDHIAELEEECWAWIREAEGTS